MGEPSKYELNAWQEILDVRDRWWRRAGHQVGDAVAAGAAKADQKTREFVGRRPRLQSGLSQAGTLVSRGGVAVARMVPDVAKDWTEQAAGATGRAIRDLTRIGLTPKRVVAQHQKKNHPVERLSDVRDLDLEIVDEVRGRNLVLTYVYPLLGAGSGAGSALVITGGELTIVPTAGASAAPTAGAVLGAIAADAAWVTGLMSRAVGVIALNYGYDPKQPGEKLFVTAVVNAGAAGTTAAKMAAMRDLSFLTQKLFRNQAWAVLNKSKIASVLGEAAKALTLKFTKKSLGKAVPVIGIGLGFTLNHDTVSRTIETAEMAYRRRFLLDKYPNLAESEPTLDPQDAVDLNEEGDEEVISIIDLLAD
jgi:EcsC protein family